MHPSVPDFRRTGCAYQCSEEGLSCLLPPYINKIFVVDIEESLFVQFDNFGFYRCSISLSTMLPGEASHGTQCAEERVVTR